MTNAGNGISLYNPGRGPQDVILDWMFTDKLTEGKMGFHVDGIESNASKFKSRYSRWLTETSQTGCINHGIGVTQDIPVFDVEYAESYFAGGGWAVYIESKYGIRVSGVVVKNNEFGADFFPGCGYWGPVYQGNRDNLETPIWEGNRTTSGAVVNW
jgi:hypothetical protein